MLPTRGDQAAPTWDERVFSIAAQVIDAAASGSRHLIRELLVESDGLEPEIRSCVQALMGRSWDAESLEAWVEGLLKRPSSGRKIGRGYRFAADRYEVERIIDRGAFGTIAAARRLVAGAPSEPSIAVKFVSIEATASLSPRQRFESYRREVEALLELGDQTHVVELLDFGPIDDSLYYLCTPLMEGSLEDLVRRETHDLRELLTLLLPIFKLLSSCHQLHPPLFHRDLAPRNILYRREKGRTILFLADFGLGTLRPAPDEGLTAAKPSRVSFQGRQFGHRLFVSPEHLVDISLVGERSEVFGCGTILYFCTTGAPPTFRSHRRLAMPEQQVDFRTDPLSLVPEPRDVNPQVPKELNWIITKCLQPASEDRYGCVAQLANDVEALLEGRPIDAQPISRTKKLQIYCRRFPERLVLFVSLLALTVGSSLWAVDRIRANFELSRQNVELTRLSNNLDASNRRLESSNETLAATASDLEESLHREEQTREAAELTTHRLLIREAQRRLAEGRMLSVKEELNRIPVEFRSLDDRLFAAQLTAPTLQVLGMHDGPVTDLLVDREHDRIVSAAQDGRLLIHSLSQPDQMQVLQDGYWSDAAGRYLLFSEVNSIGEELEVYRRLRWLRPGREFVGVTTLGRVVLWDLPSGQPQILHTGLQSASAVATDYERDSVTIGCENGDIVLIDRNTAPVSHTTLNVESAVTDVVSLGDMGWLAGTESGELLLLAPDLSHVVSRVGEAIPVWDLCVSKDQRRIAAATGRNCPVIYSVEGSHLTSRQTLHELPSAEGDLAVSIQAIEFSSDERQIWAGTNDRRLAAWDAESGQLVESRVYYDQYSPRNHAPGTAVPLCMQRAFAGISADASGADVVYGGWHGGITRATWRKSERVAALTPGSLLRFDPQQPLLLYEATLGGSLFVWDMHSLQQVASLDRWHDESIIGLSVSDSGTIMTADGRGQIRFAKLVDGQLLEVGQPYLHSCSIHTAAFSPGGERLAIIDESHTAQILNVATHDVSAQSPPLSIADVKVLEFDRSGKRLLVLGDSNSTFLIDGHSAELLDSLYWVAAGNGATSLARDPDTDGGFLVGDATGRVNLIPGPVPLPFGFNQPVGGAAIVPESLSPGRIARRVVACDALGTVRFFAPLGEFITLSLQSPLAGPHNQVSQLLISPDCRYLCLLHADGRLCVWDTGTSLSAPGDPAWESDHLIIYQSTDLTILAEKSVTRLPNGVYAMLLLEGMSNNSTVRVKLLMWDPITAAVQLANVVTIPKPTHSSMDELLGTMSLSVIGNSLCGCVRHWTEGYSARSYLFQAELDDLNELTDQVFRGSVIGDEDNAYLYQSIIDVGGEPAVVHFRYRDGRLCLTQRNETEWETRVLGRQGDGFGLRAISSKGRLSLLFGQNRVNNDLHLHYCLSMEANAPEVSTRMMLSRYQTAFSSIELHPDGSPVFVFRRRELDGELYVMASLGTDGDPNQFEQQEIFTFADPIWLTYPDDLAVFSDGSIGLFIHVYGDYNREEYFLSNSRSTWEIEKLDWDWSQSSARSFALVELANGQPGLLFLETLPGADGPLHTVLVRPRHNQDQQN